MRVQPQTLSMAMEAESRSAGHCRYCGHRLSGLGYNFVCHTCGAEYCYVHMRRHEMHHARQSQAITA